MLVSRLESWVRASSSLFSASTLRATAAGEKSSMLSKVMSTLRLPSPVSVFGTVKDTRGFIDLIRVSKLSMEITTALRLEPAGSDRAGWPASWAQHHTTETKHNYVTQSY